LTNEHNIINTHYAIEFSFLAEKRIEWQRQNAPENTNLERSCSLNLKEFQVVHEQNFRIRTDPSFGLSYFLEQTSPSPLLY